MILTLEVDGQRSCKQTGPEHRCMDATEKSIEGAIDARGEMKVLAEQKALNDCPKSVRKLAKEVTAILQQKFEEALTIEQKNSMTGRVG